MSDKGELGNQQVDGDLCQAHEKAATTACRHASINQPQTSTSSHPCACNALNTTNRRRSQSVDGCSHVTEGTDERKPGRPQTRIWVWQAEHVLIASQAKQGLIRYGGMVISHVQDVSLCGKIGKIRENREGMGSAGSIRNTGRHEK